MKKEFIRLLILFNFLIIFPTMVFSQSIITGIVKDKAGNTVKDASIYADEGSIFTKTDRYGKFTINGESIKEVLIEAKGFESLNYIIPVGSNNIEITLQPSSSLNNEVNIAFDKVKYKDLVNAVSYVNTSDIAKFDNSQAVSDLVPYLLGLWGLNLRGNSTGPLILIDGLPRDIYYIKVSEIEQITALKDASAAVLYGSKAVNGVILITTKRGEVNKKEFKVNGFYGISVPKMLPKYLSSAAYMELYDEARVNDGLYPLYGPETISKFRTGNKYRYPNIDYYSNEYLKKEKPFSNIEAELSGGNTRVQYYANIGWNYTGSLLNFGKDTKTNRFNVRGNVDVKINSWVKTSLDAVAILHNDHLNSATYWSEANSRRPNLSTPLLPIDLIDSTNTLLNAAINKLDGKFLPGGNQNALSSVILDRYYGSIVDYDQRMFSFNHRMDFNLDAITKGLAFHTNLSFDFFSAYTQTVASTYAVYEPVWSETSDLIIDLKKIGTDSHSGINDVTGNRFQRRIGGYLNLDYKKSLNDHNVTASLIGYGHTYKLQQNFQGVKDYHSALRVGYNYKSKYLMDFSAGYVHSVMLPTDNRNAISPTFGLAWVPSLENFLSDVSWLNYLKIRVSGGLINSDAGIDGFFLYDNSYSTTLTPYNWNETASNRVVLPSQGANPDLVYEKNEEYNVGFESILFTNFHFDMNLFKSRYYDQITKVTIKYPSYYSDYIPYENYSSVSYKGLEAGLTYDQDFGDFSMMVGLNGLYRQSNIDKTNELQKYEYQKRTGKPVDALFGLVSDGFFNSQDEIDAHPAQSWGVVHPGDLKYLDQNSDNVIDSYDMVQIGKGATFRYTAMLKVSYKGVSLFLKGLGENGGYGYKSGNYYQMDGDDKYSELALGRWTEATKNTATLPRLTSLANTNNYQTSTFWMYDNNYFTINRVQLSYELPYKLIKNLRMKYMNIFVEGQDVFTMSKYRRITDLVIGEPRYTRYSIGAKFNF